LQGGRLDRLNVRPRPALKVHQSPLHLADEYGPLIRFGAV
jgi:hypothetical protein